jgi:hypothetical protein
MSTQDKVTGEGEARGKRASFNPSTGEVSGSGAGAGNNPGNDEDYDSDLHEDAPVSASGRSPQ